MIKVNTKIGKHMFSGIGFVLFGLVLLALRVVNKV